MSQTTKSQVYEHFKLVTSDDKRVTCNHCKKNDSKSAKTLLVRKI